MRILFLCTKYPTHVDDSYLTSELADAWQAQGHTVDVCVLSWDRVSAIPVNGLEFPSGVKVNYFKPQNVQKFGRFFERLSRWALSSFLVRREVKKVYGQAQFDFVFAFAPATTMFGIINHFVMRSARNSMLYITDFFPIAHRDMGLIPNGPLFWLAKKVENHLMLKFGAIGCMSPMNERYLRKKYTVSAEQSVHVVRIWGPPAILRSEPIATVREKFNLPINKKLILFGGQLSEGRGVSEVLKAARTANEKNSDLHFLIVGSGRLQSVVEAAAADHHHNLIFIYKIPRDKYLELASACDLGLVSTVAHTDVPTFPSRCIDYLRAGLEILASTEATTDFGKFVEDNKIGESILAGNAELLFETAAKMIANQRPKIEVSENAIAALNEHFSTPKIASQIIEIVRGQTSKAKLQ